jgi:DNA end-binding protein Ku
LPLRASWKGFLRIAELTVRVSLYAAASTAERIALHTINRPTGHQVRREFVDAETGETVERDDRVKGYEVAKDEYVSVEPDEIAAVIPHGDKMLTVSAFVDTAGVDDLYFDKPYCLGPSDRSANESFPLVREGMRAPKAAAVAKAVLFRRARTVLLRPFGRGLAASTLNYDYEVRSAAEAFSDVSAKATTGEMLDLAVHIIKTRRAAFDPHEFHDRYGDAA